QPARAGARRRARVAADLSGQVRGAVRAPRSVPALTVRRPSPAFRFRTSDFGRERTADASLHRRFFLSSKALDQPSFDEAWLNFSLTFPPSAVTAMMT